MTTIVTRAGKGAPLTHNEVDANFTNLNTDKYQAGDDATFGTVTVTGTVDGRDIAVDGAKLDGIEGGADITDAENVNPLVDAHLNTSTAISGEFLSWNGTDYDWASVPAGYTNSDVDAHLNTSTATSSQVLSWSGTDYDWVDAGGAGAVGGGTDAIFWENDQTVTTSYTITNGKNAMSAGPITINSGVTVTVGAGEVWTVV